MEFLFHNPIADMPGSQFIWLAVVYCILVITGCKLWLNFLDPTRDRELGPLDHNIDPYEVAYLRGGEKEVALTALFNLLQKGYLVESDGKVGQAMSNSSPVDLKPLEYPIYEQFTSPRDIKGVIAGPGMLTYLAPFCSAYSNNLIRREFLKPPALLKLMQTSLFAFWVLMELPMLYKLLIALFKGKLNVIFLVGLMIVAPIGYISFCYADRTTALGEKYLAKLKNMHIQQKQTAVTGTEVAHGEAALLVALYGSTALVGTSYAYVNTMLNPTVSTGGSGDSSSCSSGSSCSSSCSSCGGGGCGGCGGD